MSIYEQIQALKNNPRINKENWKHYDYRLPESLAREATTIQNYFSDNNFGKYITTVFNKTDKFDPENYDQTRKLNRKIHKGLEKLYNSDNVYYSLSIFELHSDLKTFHSHTVNNIPPDIKDDEIKAQIKKIGKNKIKSVNVQSVYDQKGLCYYLSKGFNAEIYNEYRYKPDESEKGYRIKPAYDDYIKALPTNKRLHQTIGLKNPTNDIITQPAPAVKSSECKKTVKRGNTKTNTVAFHDGIKGCKKTVKRGNAKTPQIQAILEGVKIGNIVTYPNTTERRTEPCRPLTAHSTHQEPFRPKETHQKTAPTRSRTARTGFTSYSMYNNKPPPHTRAYRAFTAHI